VRAVVPVVVCDEGPLCTCSGSVSHEPGTMALRGQIRRRMQQCRLLRLPTEGIALAPSALLKGRADP
jgi:hypothetical protein